MDGWEFLFVLFLAAIPLGLVFARYWARALRGANRRPKVPPGDPGNPT